MKFTRIFLTIALMSTAGLFALKVVPVEDQCQQNGLRPGTKAFNQCVAQKNEEIRKMQEELGYTSSQETMHGGSLLNVRPAYTPIMGGDIYSTTGGQPTYSTTAQ